MLERDKLLKRVAGLVLPVVLVACSGCELRRGKDVMAANGSGREKAQELVAAYAHHAGVRDAVHQALDASGDRSFGEFGFHYFSSPDRIETRVYIIGLRLKEATPEMKANLEKTIAAYNDPKIGGMFDKGGGHFVVDESKDAEYLVKSYPLAGLDDGAFAKDVDHLRALGAMWLMSWGPHVADEVFEGAAAPKQLVISENNSYAR